MGDLYLQRKLLKSKINREESLLKRLINSKKESKLRKVKKK